MKKIMIIDDNETNLKMLDLVLSKEGYKTDTIVNPKFALDIIQESMPDLILLDINMPEVNGFQICKGLKKDKKTKDIPIIFVSTLSNTEYIVGGLALGGVDYITKPIKADEVKARIAVQLKIADTQKKLLKSNEQLKQTINDAALEKSDIQSDLVYSLTQIIDTDENSEKHLSRVSDFCKYMIKQVITDSPYPEKFSDEVIGKILKDSFSS